jgi:hypothetical protein
MLQTKGMNFATWYRLRASVKYVRIKLSIQGIVHCSVMDKRNLCPRWIFNLSQVSIKALVNQNSNGNENFKSMPWNLVGTVGLIGPSAY